jgi:hypothetical protein
MQQFIDDESGYLGWIAGHPSGFVVNALREPRPEYLILHRATCGTISGMPARGNYWTKDFGKTCSLNRAELEGWARRHVGGELHPCGLCRP